MTEITWDRLGPREKQVLAILRRDDRGLTAREVLNQLDDAGTDIAYTTVSTILERLTDKGLVDRDQEKHAGSPRYRYRFESRTYRQVLVEDIVDDVATVLGPSGLALLADQAEQAANTNTETNS